VLALLGLALALRLFAVFVFPVAPSADAAGIEEVGRSVAEGKGYLLHGRPDTILPPGVPTLIALVYMAFGPHPTAVAVAQALLDTGACYVLWLWMRRRLSPRLALVTLGLAAVSLSAIGATRILRGECMGGVLLVVALALFDLGWSSSRRLLLMAGAGLVLGLATLFRWNFSLFPLFLLPLLAFRPGRWPAKAAAAGVMLAVFAAVLAPRLVRMQRLLGAPVLSSQSGITLYSSHVRTPGQPWGNNTDDDVVKRARTMPPLEGSNYLVAETKSVLRQDPARLFTQYPIKVFWLLVPFDWEVLGSRVFNVTYFAIAVLALLGARAAWRHDPHLTALLILPLAYLVVLCFPFYGSPRFRLPAEPMLTPLAAFGAVWLARLKSTSAQRGEAAAPQARG
jgi:4-amino-4-deoxy-L-arabinose transferase-like glycosyltransferase